jgi:sulfide dehydrogenase [flavocytochrome c] flavoprotein subunit
MAWTRRNFLQAGSALAAQTLSGCGKLGFKTNSPARVVIIGGGFAGATAAKTLRQLDPNIQVTLIEPKSIYISCPASNWLLARLTSLQQLTIEYRDLQDRHAIDIVNTSVTAIEAGKRQVILENGERLNYDRLIVSPGIDFRWDAIVGYDQDASQLFPHAWQAGPQTLQLAAQLQDLPAGGVIVMSVPADPYRCPPGPYERASMMAWWLKLHNPHAKILILDHKRSFSKQAQFEHLWKQHYGYGSANSLIEWHSLADNPINRFDADSKTLSSEFGDHFSGDLINIIPPQQAGRIAIQSGLTDSSGWCQIDPFTAQSKVDAYIHVIGDAAQFAPIPKSAFAAHSEAKSCALAVVSLLRDLPPPAPNWLNTCYSLVTAEHGISIAGVYSLDEQKAIALVKGSGGISSDLSEQALRKEAQYARGVYRNLLANSFD